MTNPSGFDARELFKALARHHVEYVTIGGIAIQAYGGQRLTQDLDIAIATSAENIARLASALLDLDARVLGPDTLKRSGPATNARSNAAHMKHPPRAPIAEQGRSAPLAFETRLGRADATQNTDPHHRYRSRRPDPARLGCADLRSLGPERPAAGQSTPAPGRARLQAMAQERTIREGALQPKRDPPSDPPGPRGTTPLNPITGRPIPQAPAPSPPSHPQPMRPSPMVGETRGSGRPADSRK